MIRTVRPRHARRLAGALGCATVLAVLAGSIPGDAGANVAPGDGSAKSQAAEVTQGAGFTNLTPTITVSATTAVLGLLGLNAPGLTSTLTTSVTTPLANALVALPNAVTSQLAGSLVNAGYKAQNSDGQQPRPASGFPTCGQRGWTSSNCYGPVTPVTSTGPSASVAGGTVQGYATGDSQGFVAEARSANPVITLLGFTLGDLGIAASAAQCGKTGSCSASQSLSGGSLLADNSLRLSFANGGAMLATLNGAQIPAAGASSNAGGFATTIAANGSLATITVGLTLPQLLSALGLPNLLTSVATLGVLADDGTVATMTIKVGPGSISQTSPASAWGVAVSVDLSVNIKLKLTATVLGISTTIATIGLKPTSTPPSVADFKLAYSQATAGNVLPGWVPTTLV